MITSWPRGTTIHEFMDLQWGVNKSARKRIENCPTLIPVGQKGRKTLAEQ
jgi:hypothetical protein